jgi:hypothetical protein
VRAAPASAGAAATPNTEADSTGAAAAAEGTAVAPPAAERARLFVSHAETLTAAKTESRGVFIARPLQAA